MRGNRPGVAFRLGHRFILSPVVEHSAAGNGAHIHFNLRDAAGRRVMNGGCAKALVGATLGPRSGFFVGLALLNDRLL